MTAHIRPAPRRTTAPRSNEGPRWHATFVARADVGTATVTARGVLDIFTVEYLRGEIELLRRSGVSDVQLDLDGLNSIDLTAANYLRGLDAELAAAGGSLQLRHANQAIRSRLEAVRPA